MTRSFQFSTSFGLGSRPRSEMRRAYDPVLRNHFDHYLQGSAKERENLIEGVWQDLGSEELTLPPAASEPQFVFHLAGAFLARCCAQDSPSAERSLDAVQQLLESLSIYQRKCAFLLLSGYPKDWAGTLLNVGTVQIFNTLEELRARSSGDLPVIAAADKLALQQKAPRDPEYLRRLEALIEGVLHWEEKQQLEEEAAQRLEVLDALVTLEEINHFLVRDRDRQIQAAR